MSEKKGVKEKTAIVGSVWMVVVSEKDSQVSEGKEAKQREGVYITEVV